MNSVNPNSSGSLAGGKPVKFNGVKVFSATMVADRDRLGEKVTDWMSANADLRFTDIVVTQSSDESFHCIAITLFYWDDDAADDLDDDDRDDRDDRSR